ncbi:MAG: ATP-binding protein, partial [Desulfopila sp.]|nr:ATP-binding protein [Desulfopila sp.]
IEKCLERADLIQENRKYQRDLEGLVYQKTQELSEINARLKAVVESTKKLLGCGRLDESGALLLHEFGTHMEATGGSIYKVGEKGLYYLAGIDNGHAPPMLHFPLKPDSVFSRVMKTGEPLFLDDISGEESVISSGWDQYRDNSLLVFPIVDAGGKILAIVSLHSKKQPPFNSQDYDIGRILASYAGEAFHVAEVSEALQSSEDRLRQAQKMEAIGTLAGGIAHDFNNILAAIIGYTDLSLFSGSCNEVVRKNLEQVKNAGNRAKELVAQILTFSRMEEFKENAVDIAPIIKEALKLLRATIPSSIKITTDIPEGLGKITTDPTKIYQVLMNLCTNAVHAMQSGEGVLGIRFARVGGANLPLEIQQSLYRDWLELSISDTGEGIAQKDIERIFDPYFTTKDKGEGTGLGLAMVHSIVRASGGIIEVESVPGEGSTFTLFFPSVELGREIKEDVSFGLMKGGNETILFVDDEVNLTEMAGEMLGKLGYQVYAHSNSREALDIFYRNPDRFDLLITDQTMPEISGVELARRALSLRPDLPVILYTGYSAALEGMGAEQLGIREILMKPLSMSMLAEAVRRALDA